VGVRKSLTLHKNTMENTLVGIVAGLLIAYLIFSIIRPEKF
jgi:K+-transporting ATPase KdpF subunit